MENNIRYNNLVIFTFIIILGLGFALLLPWLANHQSLAAQSERNEFVDLTTSLASEVNTPDADTCFATPNNGTTVFASPDAGAVQQAVDAASPGEKVKVAGICVGVQPRAGLTQTVYISKSITLEGGHTESDWTLEPDPETYTTTLDANRLGRVVVIFGTVDVNFDSLFISGGLADDGTLSDIGGGIYSNGSLTLTNSIVFSNTALAGGGMFSYIGSELYIKNGTFMNNKAFNNGGGLVAYYISSTLDTVEFIGNQAFQAGGMHAIWGNLSMNTVNFSGNVADDAGGGLVCYLSDCKSTNLTFINNVANTKGGAIWLESTQSVVMTNTIFSGNKSENGAGFYYMYSNSTLINATFSGNYATENGGGMYLDFSRIKAYNSVYWNNLDSSGPGTISSTIYADTGSIITLTNSIAEASGGSGTWGLDPSRYVDGGFNKDTDPLFVTPVDPTTAPTADGDLRLTENSPAIDMGNNGFINVPFDLDGNQRVVDGDGNGTATVDMGAYEFLPEYLLTVNKTGSGDGTVTSIPAGIDCGTTCSTSFIHGSIITLTAQADVGSQFTDWSGDCSDSGDCEVTMDEPKNVTANFELDLGNYLPLITR